MFQFNTIEEALEDLRQGKVILVTDDEDRENEGDMICARICNDRKREPYGQRSQGSDLHAYERRVLHEAAVPADGQRKHRQP